jgi:hypothetical protein
LSSLRLEAEARTTVEDDGELGRLKDLIAGREEEISGLKNQLSVTNEELKTKDQGPML